LNKHSS